MLLHIDTLREVLAAVSDIDLRAAIDGLSRSDQELIALRLCGYTQREIARSCKLSQSTISRRLSQIYIKMARMLKK